MRESEDAIKGTGWFSSGVVSGGSLLRREGEMKVLGELLGLEGARGGLKAKSLLRMAVVRMLCLRLGLKTWENANFYCQYITL